MQIPHRDKNKTREQIVQKHVIRTKKSGGASDQTPMFFGVDIFEVLHQRQARLKNLL
jgi:hypothetical protein